MASSIAKTIPMKKIVPNGFNQLILPNFNTFYSVKGKSNILILSSQRRKKQQQLR
jgi:hypothetical protein